MFSRGKLEKCEFWELTAWAQSSPTSPSPPLPPLLPPVPPHSHPHPQQLLLLWNADSRNINFRKRTTGGWRKFRCSASKKNIFRLLLFNFEPVRKWRRYWRRKKIVLNGYNHSRFLARVLTVLTFCQKMSRRFIGVLLTPHITIQWMHRGSARLHARIVGGGGGGIRAIISLLSLPTP